jgi:hypothetical protein
MEDKMKNLAITLLLLSCALVVVASAQKKPKPWTEWSKKEAEAILNESAWGQTQIETDTSEMFFRPQADPNVKPKALDPARDARGGATNQATSVKYRIRFLSAKPIRQAIARAILLGNPAQSEQMAASMRDFVERKFDQWIAVAVTFESRDQRYLGPATQAFGSATAEVLKNKTYLERKDGKRLFLQMYQAPGADGLGAKFIFPRVVDGKPFLDRESGEVRFASEVSNKIRMDMRFKVSEMVYDGQLEY